MTKLKLFSEQDGKSWTLKPSREYLVGSGSQCQITVSDRSIDSEHLKLSFDPNNNTWQVDDLGSSNGTFINNRRISHYSITSQTSISVAHQVTLVATPEASRNNFTAIAPSSTVTSTTNAQSIEAVEIKQLTWKQYVRKQVKAQQNILAGLITNFNLSTGLRRTPWVYLRGENQPLFGSGGFIIPDFLERGTVQEVGRSIINNLGLLRQYENTDCCLVELTDEQLINSAQETILQRILSFRFFPSRRGGEGKFDYRKFLLVSYNQIKTYLIVESYGDDLVVSWITRYEPYHNSGFVIWLLIAVILTLLIISRDYFGNLIFATLPLCLWAIVYLLLPQIMKVLNILPKRANAYLLGFILVINYVFSFLYGIFQLTANSTSFVTTLGMAIGTFFIILVAFLFLILLNLLIIGVITAAIFALEKLAVNPGNLSRR